MASENRPEISAVRWNHPESGTLSGHIVAQVRAALFAGELKSGDYLGTALPLAEQFGVSRIAARDALRALAAMGIVEVRTARRGGVWISQGNPGYLANAPTVQFQGLRQLLEPAYRPHTTPEISAQAIEAHEKIIAMIAARDAEGARRAVADRLAYIRATGFLDTRVDPAG